MGKSVCIFCKMIISLNQIAKETANQFSTSSLQEHVPLGKSMVAMAIRAISAVGMGRAFREEKEIDKLSTVYELVRYAFV